MKSKDHSARSGMGEVYLAEICRSEFEVDE